MQPGAAECAGLQDQPQSGTRCGAGLPKPQFLHQTSGVTGNTTSQAVEQEQEVGSEPVSFWERDPGWHQWWQGQSALESQSVALSDEGEVQKSYM